MATQQNNGKGRIYQSRPAEATYQGAARSIGFNPVQAANQEKRQRQYKAAIVADGETLARELTRQQAAENTALQAQQTADAGALKMEQLGESAELKQTQLFDKNVMEQDHAHQKGIMALELSHLKASGQVQAAKTKVIGSAIQGILSFGNSVLQYSQQMDALQKQQEAEKAEQLQTDALNNAFFGDNFYGPTEAEVEETNAAGEVINSGLQAEATALGDAAKEIRSEAPGDPFNEYQAQQIESMSSWNQLADVRGNVFAARMQYGIFLQEAKAQGLIRPGAQGLQDIQNLNRKFADATGLTQAAIADPKFVADNFTKSANGVAQNVLSNIASENAAEIKAAREAKVNTNIASNFAGLSSQSSVAEVGAAWAAANAENVNGNYGGRMSSASSYSTTKKVAKELADSGRTAELQKLKQYAPNPNTPNLTLGKQFGDLIDAEILRSRQQARTQYNLGKGELNIQAEQIADQYWQNPTPENLRQAEAQLRAINTGESRRLADKLVQNGYDYDPSVAQDIARRRGTDTEAGVAEIQDAFSKGLISKQEYTYAISKAPDAAIGKKIDEAIKLYQPGKGIVDNVAALDGGRAEAVNRPSPAFKQELRMKEKRFNIELGRRLQTVLRSNPNLDVESQEFQDIVTKEAEFLRQQQRFQISFDASRGYFFGKDTTQQSDYLEQITIAPGQQNFYGRSATDIFQTARISKAMVDPSVDQILPPAEITRDTTAIINGESVSKRTNDWAAALGMSAKDFINGQRLQQGLPAIDRVKQSVIQGNPPSEFQKMSFNPYQAKDIKNEYEGTSAFRAQGMPLRGAAYMSSAIMHESNWHGTREWGEVAGDGTNRNGGLLSWASWAGNSARLGQIERRYGRNISQISEQEQVEFIMHELKTSYPESYQVFMNPNASSADLQWATWNYIRWDKRYTKTRWSVAEALIRWGTNANAI